MTWNQVGSATVSVARDEDNRSQYMCDELQNGVRHYNTCYSAKVINDYGIYLPDSSQGNELVYFSRVPGSILDGYTNVSPGSVAWRDIECSNVIAAVKPHLTRRTTPTAEELSSRLEEILPLFGDPRLPAHLPIRRDPFDTDFSIWYVLVDLLDLKKSVKSIAKSLFSVRNSIPKKMTARDLHDGHLGLRFGIIPTIRDIQDLLKTISQWKKKYDDIGGFSSKRFVAHDRVDKLHQRINLFDLDDWEQNVSFTLPIFENGSPLTCKVKKTTTSSWHAQALYGFSCPEFQGWVSRLAQITDSFGVLDPAAAWDVIPFSFIIDWFFSVSSWLHKNRPRLFPATAIVYDYLETIKLDHRVSYELTAAYTELASPYYSVRTDIIGTETYSTYHRLRFWPPDGHVVLAPGGVGSNSSSFVALSNRVAIASSLVAQRLPR